MVNQFINFCKENLNLENSYYSVPYQSLSVCILDCVYSLRAQYYSTTVPLVQRYADKFMNGDPYNSGDTLEKFIANINNNGGVELFAKNILKNKQRLGGDIKSFVCYEIARKLLLLGIDDLTSFRNFNSLEILEIVIKSVKGMGTAGMNYLFMLVGDPNRCKPDVHIHHCICDAIGHDISDEECQTLLTSAVSILKQEYPNLTVKDLDGLIWSKYQVGNRGE